MATDEKIQRLQKRLGSRFYIPLPGENIKDVFEEGIRRAKTHKKRVIIAMFQGKRWFTVWPWMDVDFAYNLWKLKRFKIARSTKFVFIPLMAAFLVGGAMTYMLYRDVILTGPEIKLYDVNRLHDIFIESDGEVMVKCESSRFFLIYAGDDEIIGSKLSTPPPDWESKKYFVVEPRKISNDTLAVVRGEAQITLTSDQLTVKMATTLKYPYFLGFGIPLFLWFLWMQFIEGILSLKL